MNMMKMMGMLKQAQELQGKAAKMQEELAARRYEASAGDGKVKVVVNGEGRLLELKIDPALLAAGDAEMLEDLIVSAVREAQDRAKQEMQAEMGALTAGLNLPGLGG